ncbi:T9SS type B sorting domain-containing protein [Bizionia arctica]|uniref:T9SS type B sorting domain-containing protein n=1 Tax=Bizionia arctica TaxID=1495645 RepID=A0A917LUI5_9FLAO|nr:T9SS type B sorting domain-containing protein [Bizionia arctica]GGG57358.1 hypothetical protein GCM10010976_30240 [Bizionia arctica]
MKILPFYIILFGFFTVYSQEEASNWYFGNNAGIQFNTLSGAVTAKTDGQLNTKEGCASISDEEGNLLFYTDGVTVYNKLHHVMNNGENLYGDDSSTQSAIIVPKPEDSNIYYIFTVDSASNGTNQGLNYSTVDISLDGGLGTIVSKNDGLLEKCSEKITAVLKDCGSESIWVIAFAAFDRNDTGGVYNTFHAFDVSSNGVNTNSIRSFGPVISDARGYLKTSPNGKKLAAANVRDGLYLFDFNTSNGRVTNEEEIELLTVNWFPYGVEFSPNNQYLYIHAYNDIPSTDFNIIHTSALLQFDLLNPSISSSMAVLDNRDLYRGGLQLGPDGKIYRSLSHSYLFGSPYLGVINNPNGSGASSNYVHNAIDLGGRPSTQGLPPFITSFFNQKIDIINNGEESTYLPLCEGDNYTLIAEEIVGATYTWYQDGILLPEENFNLTVTESGVYEVIIHLSSGNCETYEGKANIEFFEKPTVTNVSLIQCDEDGLNDGQTIFNLEEANDILIGSNSGLEIVYYNYYFDAENELNPITNNIFTNSSNPQTIFAHITSAAASCSTIAEVSLEISTTQILDYNSPIVCDDIDSEDGYNTFNLNDFEADMQTINSIGYPITFYETYLDALLEQNELVSPYNNITPYSQTIFARAESNNACYGINKVYINVNRLPELENNETVYYCLNIFPQTIPISAEIRNDSSTNFTYLWSNGETTETIYINQLGTYIVTVTDMSGCSKSKSIIVESSNTATFINIITVDANENNTITVLVSGEGQYQYALYNQDGLYATYQSSNIFYNVYGGIYTVAVKDIKNNCGTVSQVISIIGFPKIFTPNGDGYNDTWNIKGGSNVFQPDTVIRIYDRYGKLIKQISPLGEGWDGTFNGNQLPNTDYWFSVMLQDGRKFQSHFTLKR